MSGGFSKNYCSRRLVPGRQAGYIEKEDGAFLQPYPGYTFNFIVFDSVQDKILWTDSYFEPVNEIGDSVEPDAYLPKAWEALKIRFSRQMFKHGIIEQEFSLKSFPLEYNGVTYFEWIENEKWASSEKLNFDIWVYSTKGGVTPSGKRIRYSGKKVTSVTFKDFKFSGKYVIDGYFMSPYEPRILILYTLSGNSPPYSISSEIESHSKSYLTGCHLTVDYMLKEYPGK